MASPATIYNVLNDFYHAGLLTKVNIGNDKTWYDTNVEHHYHIFSEKNSELVDLEPSEIEIKIPKKFIKNQKINKDKFRSVSDFISGMTDRYAINLYNNLK